MILSKLENQTTAVVFGFIVAITQSTTLSCARNDTINTMVTRRPKHTRHANSHMKTNQRASRRVSTRSNSLPRHGRRSDMPTYKDSSATSLHPEKETLLTRRNFLYGAIGVGALAAIGTGATIVSQLTNDDEDITALEVPSSAVTSSNDLSLIEDYTTRMSLVGNFALPYGSLLWANDDALAACLLPTETGKPLTQVALLELTTGNLNTILEWAIGGEEGFEVYDVRATSAGIIWTEADILDGIWRIYTSKLSGTTLVAPTLVDEGNTDYDTPSIAAVGSWGFWQVLPKLNGPKITEDSVVKSASFGETNSEVIYSSTGRMATSPYGLEDTIVITPRTNTSSINYQLTLLDAQSKQVIDSMVLPSSMKPLEAGYGNNGFTFSFDGIYSYGDGISNLGTYTPATTVSDGNYSAAPWFTFARTPTAAPAWCGKYFMVKSTSAVCGIDLETNEYFAFDVENGADSYGEYLASTGSRNTVVTYTNVDYTPLSGDAVKTCHVRVWSPI